MIARRIAHAIERRDSTLKAPSSALLAALGAVPSSSGVSVSATTAMQHGDVYACIRVLADAAASLPLLSYERTGDGRVRDDDTFVARLLRNPAPGMTQSMWVSTVMHHLNMWGNTYVAKLRGARGQIVQFRFIDPSRVAIKLDNGEPVFKVYPSQQSDQIQGEFTSRDILHIKGLSTDGVQGLSPIRQAREAIGAGIALEEYAARFFANSAIPDGMLQTDGKLSQEAQDRLKTQWEAVHRGRSNAHKVAVLEEGLKWQSVSLPMEDVQFVEQRKYSATQIARIFRVPPYMIGADGPNSMTYSNVEQESIHFVTYSLRPWLVTIEQAINADEDLYGADGPYYTEFLVDALLRSDTLSRMQAYEVGTRTGVMSVNEAREKENRPPIPGGDVPPWERLPGAQAA